MDFAIFGLCDFGEINFVLPNLIRNPFRFELIEAQERVWNSVEESA